MKIPPAWLSTGFAACFALLPWSVELDFGSWNLSLPGDVLVGFLGIALALLFFQNLPLLKSAFSNSIFLQLGLAYMVWMAVCAGFSTMPLISWKYWLVEAGQWWVFGVGIFVWPDMWRRVIPWLVFSLAGLSLYVLAHHGVHHFRADQVLLAPMPFFPENTMWAAVLGMAIFLANLPNLEFPKPLKPWVIILLTLALTLSFCRAAWMTFLLTLLLGGAQLWGKKWIWVLLLPIFLLAIFGWIRTGDAWSHDVSAKERVNRWRCALRMAKEKPLLGFGPGTYQFQYIGFQNPPEMTRISLQKPMTEGGPDYYGRGGGAHSEYWRALAETGWPGLGIWVSMVLLVLWRGFLGRKHRTILMVALALLSYFLHGLVNDFLHDGCVSAMVWGGMAVVFARAGEEV